MLEENKIENQNNNITEEQVLEAIKNNLQQNKQITRDFEQEIYNGVKEDLLKLEKISEENIWTQTNK